MEFCHFLSHRSPKYGHAYAIMRRMALDACVGITMLLRSDVIATIPNLVAATGLRRPAGTHLLHRRDAGVVDVSQQHQGDGGAVGPLSNRAQPQHRRLHELKLHPGQPCARCGWAMCV